MQRAIVIGWMVLQTAVGVAWAAGSGSVDKPVARPDEEPTAAEIAIEHYNAGVASREDAWKLEGKLARAAPEDRSKLTAKIDRAHQSAVRELTAAVEADPNMHQAWSNLGYAKRRTGDLEGALAAYDRALALKPGYPQAVEYRAEAYLLQGRIEDAQRSHDELRRADPKLADELLGAMRTWVAARRTDPRETKVGQLDELERWIDAQDRGELPLESSLHKARGW